MKKFKEYLLTTVGVAIVVFGLEYFHFPNDIASGGISGLALAINAIIPISISTFNLIVNIILFGLSFALIGGSFGIKSIYSTIVTSGLMWVCENLIKPEPITDNLLLATIFGSAIIAFGTAIVFNQNASTGGTSIIAKLLNKFLHTPIGQALLATDFLISLLAVYSFGVEKGLFGLLSVVLIGNLIDKFIAGINPVKQIFIVTKDEEVIVNYINKTIIRGCTIIPSKGGYTKEDTSVIYSVLTSKQFIMLKNFVRENDLDAFITVSESTEVLGKWFTE